MGNGIVVHYYSLGWATASHRHKTRNFFDDSTPDQGNHIPWRDLPNWEDELGELLAGILEHSRSAAQWHAPAANDDTTPLNYTTTIIAEVARAPGPDDYPLWRVHCRVSWLHLASTKNLSNHPVRHGTRTHFFSFANCAAPSPVAI